MQLTFTLFILLKVSQLLCEIFIHNEEVDFKQPVQIKMGMPKHGNYRKIKMCVKVILQSLQKFSRQSSLF